MTKNTAIVVVVLVLAGLGWWFLTQSQKSPIPSSPQATPTETSSPATESAQMGEVRQIKVSGSEFSFSPANLLIKQGEKVRITFQNDGKFPHNLTIDELGIATKTISPGQTDTIELTADQTGSYVMYCSVDQHRQKGMEGQVQLQ